MYKTKIKSGGSTTISALGAENKPPRTGVSFMDGEARGPWKNGSSKVDDVWQEGFVPNSLPINPAANNDGKYVDSKWKAAAIKIAFEGIGPPTRPKGYLDDIRFNEFKDSAGRNGTVANGFAPTKLHKYAPITGKKFQDLNDWGKTRILAGATSTSVGGLHG
jgi:hypothetical protein